MKWMGGTPADCNLCHNPFGCKNTKFFVDGKTLFGPWAIMCDTCHRDQGGKLGKGFGQRYNVETLEKVGG